MNQRRIVHAAVAGLAASIAFACASSMEPGGTSGYTGGTGNAVGGSSGAAAGGSAGSGGTTTGGTITGGTATGGLGTGGVSATGGKIGSGGMIGSGGGGGTATGGLGTTGGAGTTGGTTGGSGGGSSSEPCTGAGTLKTGDSEHSLTVGEYEYPFNVHVPPGYDGVTRLPVMFDFHGLGGNEDQMQRLSGWASTGDAEGFITVFPGGPDNGWNAGGCCTDTPTDVDFVREAIMYMDSVGCIDTKRIYASGCSNGGAMSFRLACEAADVIAAVAPVDFDCVAGGFGCQECNPVRPITEVQFRATEDQAVDYGSETSGARANFANWGEINMCTGDPAPLAENSSCQAHSMCDNGVQTILCTVEGGTHCANYMSFGIANLAWGIISQYSLP